MYSLLSGDIFLAIRCWPPILIALPAAAALWGMWFASAWRGEHFVLRVPQWLLWTLVIGVLGFGVVRNFPALSLLRPPF